MAVNLINYILQPFAKYGTKNSIPQEASEATGAAGYNLGFPYVTMVNIAAGGIPPDGRDMNGILYDLSQAIQFIQAGQEFPFNNEFANSIGGYAVGAIVSDTVDKYSFWINSVANNLDFPAGWSQFRFGQSTESINGTAKIATQLQTDTGTDDSTIITPKKLRWGVSFSGNHVALPSWLGGFIIQWNKLYVTPGLNANASLRVNFPVEFPANCLYVSTSLSGSPNGAVNASSEQITKSGYTIVSAGYYTPQAAIEMQFLAIGR